MATIKSLEEKAKAYDEAIKRVENIKAGKCETTFIFTEGLFEYIFPELIESEDEKIRKEIEFFIAANHKDDAEKAHWLYWLEKQGEQKAIKHNNDATIDSNLNDYCCKVYSALHKENGGNLSFARLQHLAMDIYKWCKEQQKPAEWSEEDEKILSDIIKDLVHPWNEYIPDRIEDEIKWLKNRLKSLKDRYTWKPSKEQIGVVARLRHCLLEDVRGNDVVILDNLLEQLKAL